MDRRRSKKTIGIADFRKLPFILVPSASYGDGQRLDQLAWKTGLLSKQTIHELDSFEAAKEFISAGVGVGLLPRWVAKPALDTKKIHEVKIRELSNSFLGPHTFHASFRKSDRENPTILAVVLEASGFLTQSKQNWI